MRRSHFTATITAKAPSARLACSIGRREEGGGAEGMVDQEEGYATRAVKSMRERYGNPVLHDGVMVGGEKLGRVGVVNGSG